ncbi:hypothetical protein HBI56_124120 [Parastagonospora nodorum]|nr:hypothetical protein HBH53_103310 [Parastagonospora nodorum]KAH3997037.1 hypothetical protein HBI10_148290 [Parastagonospora nodorum]KAH4020040.1 hypothetical protein HBI13_121430 [Parastagonospora nodorum]KAH4057053.1 hypothetical protein HBH49_041100 [Parastagonospora nodorum]KAH4110231.1 hypothetical protein HBH46_020080 [Parastagonospora nodorum]
MIMGVIGVDDGTECDLNLEVPVHLTPASFRFVDLMASKAWDVEGQLMLIASKKPCSFVLRGLLRRQTVKVGSILNEVRLSWICLASHTDCLSRKACVRLSRHIPRKSLQVQSNEALSLANQGATLQASTT